MENKGGKDDEVSEGVWQAVEASIGKIRMEETEKRRSKGGIREKKGREG